MRDTSVAITGGARGIGLATAKAFAAQGARVFLGDLDETAVQEAAAEIGGKGYRLDVRSRESFAAFLAAVDGPLDVLVNNAGIMPMGRFADEDDSVTDAILDINVKGVLTGTKLALPGMLERRYGHIVNIGSYLGEVPGAGLASYCASKHAVIGFSESLRDELHGTGVTVTAVLPSAVRTDLVAGVHLGGILPTVDPERIAAAVIASCAHRRTIVAVPGWMRTYELAAALLPDRLLAAVRGHLTRDRVLHHLDTAARSAYDARVRRDADTHS
ncbi:SDR family oxidoreductase [Nocardia sp. NBC_01327]|uniref:SDR family oxidoreductase n=1 Tax=Nocardia sp. NBC_01327 TaxID=2903593 RepID=UPI002E0FEC35|nr:SDR family oxidoreductase [Nocardia sp. NBC_01327]